MKNKEAKQKAVAAIRVIVEAAKELAKAEQAFYGNKSHKQKSRYKTIKENKRWKSERNRLSVRVVRQNRQPATIN